MNKWIMAGTAAAFTGAAAFARSEYERTHLDIVHYDIKTDKLGLEWNGFKAVFFLICMIIALAWRMKSCLRQLKKNSLILL